METKTYVLTATTLLATFIGGANIIAMLLDPQTTNPGPLSFTLLIHILFIQTIIMMKQDLSITNLAPLHMKGLKFYLLGGFLVHTFFILSGFITAIIINSMTTNSGFPSTQVSALFLTSAFSTLGLIAGISISTLFGLTKK